MCGRYTRHATWEQLHTLYSIHDAAPPPNTFGANYNVAPTTENPILINEDGRNKLVMARWWFHMPWAKRFESSPKYSMFNARTDRLKNSKAYWSAFSKGQRCLVSMNGFYEWVKQDDGKQCTLIEVEEEPLYSMAGIYSRHDAIPDKDGYPVNYTFTIFTTEPNETFVTYHNRMPRPVPAGDYALWMDPSRSAEDAYAYLQPLDEDSEQMHWKFTTVKKPGPISN